MAIEEVEQEENDRDDAEITECGAREQELDKNKHGEIERRENIGRDA